MVRAIAQVNAPDYHVNDIWLKHKPLPVRDEVIKYAGDTLDYLPKEYLRNYKNPCWMVGNNLKCLPYFQILGRWPGVEGTRR